ncbi:MAG: DUF952 domain-containing protein [Hyphomicrobiales bacterium]|nr:DUF952 domain-containing protein [Hyphomicrobiales bacterium]
MSSASTALIYKLHPASDWALAERAGVFAGAPVDLADGFLHFSTAAQVVETAAKHFAAVAGLLLIAVDAAGLGPALRWEASRGGALFPHLYGPLPLAAVRWIEPLPLAPGGQHVFPRDMG